MNSYQINWTKKAWKELQKLDYQIATGIFQTIKNDLARDPLQGKKLKGNWSGFYSYRYTRDYRIIYEISESEQTIEIFSVGNRSDVYE